MTHIIRILLLEDNPGDARLIQEYLKEGGSVKFDLTHVQTLKSGLERIDAEMPEVILLDLGLPDSQKLESLERIMTRVSFLPVIVLTGLNDSEMAVKAMQAGAQDYLIKGEFNSDFLIRVIQYSIERKQAQTVLEKNQKLLFEAERISHTGGWDWDIENNQWTVSDEWMRIHGINTRILPTEQLMKLAFPEDVPKIELAFRKAIDHNHVYDIEHRIIRSDTGQVRFIQAYGEIVSDQNGKPIHMIGVAQDITERKQNEEIVVRLEQRSNALIENAPDGIVLIGNDGKLIYASPSAIRTFGYKNQEIIGINPAEYTHPEDVGLVLSLLSELVSNPEAPAFTIQYRFKHKDGSWVWVESTFTNLLSDPSVEAIVINFRDITDRVQSEHRLHLQSAALEAAANAIIITDRNGTIEWVNQAWVRLTGYSFDDVIGKNPRILKSGIQDQKFYENLWNTILSGKVWRGEMVNKRKDGSLYTEEESITPIRSANGQIDHFIGIKVDISDRKQQEETIIKRNKEVTLLYEAGVQLSQNLDLKNIYKTFYDLISDIMKCDNMFISGYDYLTELITAKFAMMEGVLVAVDDFPAIPLEPEGQGIQSPVIRSGKSRLINNYFEALKQTNKNYFVNEQGKIEDAAFESNNEPVTQSALILPVNLNSQVTGIVQIQSYEKNAYTDDNLRIAEALVSQIAVAANNAELYQQTLNEINARKQAELSLQKHAERQEQMAELGRNLASTLDLDEIYRISERHLRKMIDCPKFSIIDFDSENLAFTAVYNVVDGEFLDPNTLPVLNFNDKDPLMGRSLAVKERRSIVIYDLPALRRATGGNEHITGREAETAIFVPIIVSGEIIGVLDLQSYQKGAYSVKDGEWLSVVANQIGLSIQNVRLFTQTSQRVKELLVLHNIDQIITSSANAQTMYPQILSQILTQPFADGAGILIFNKKENVLRFASGVGLPDGFNTEINIKVGESFAGNVMEKGCTVKIFKENDDSNEYFSRILWEEGYTTYVGLPLLSHDEPVGVLEIFSKNPKPPEGDWIDFMETLAQQVAIAVENNQLFRDLLNSNDELLQAYDATIAGWSQAMDLRDKETEGHTERVTSLSVKIGRALGLTEEELIHLRRGALLHDIGKLGVPDSILNKVGPLTDDEWVIMKQHPVFAYEMLISIEYLRPALAIPYCHHEKWDGSGYPRGLKEHQIPIEARIFSLIDVYDALISDRPYRSAWKKEKIIKYIQDLSGIQFDPELTPIFLEFIRNNVT